jgi:hypothetical protein
MYVFLVTTLCISFMYAQEIREILVRQLPPHASLVVSHSFAAGISKYLMSIYTLDDLRLLSLWHRRRSDIVLKYCIVRNDSNRRYLDLDHCHSDHVRFAAFRDLLDPSVIGQRRWYPCLYLHQSFNMYQSVPDCICAHR